MRSITKYLTELSFIKKLPLRLYLHKHILPIYNNFDKGHDQRHALEVANFCVLLSKKLNNVDPDIAYCVGLMHDVGLKNNREFHHIESGKYIKNSNFLKIIFDDEQIKLIKEAVEDHRASNKKSPRNIYGKIVSDSDRSDLVDIEVYLKRTWGYRESWQETNTDEEIFKDTFEYLPIMIKKIKFILPETKQLLKIKFNELKKYSKNKKMFYDKCKQMRKDGVLKRTYNND